MLISVYWTKSVAFDWRAVAKFYLKWETLFTVCSAGNIETVGSTTDDFNIFWACGNLLL